MKKIGVIHTTQATVDSLTKLIKTKIEYIDIINILDDSILKDMMTETNIDFVEERWLKYAKTLERLKVNAILSACSTVGEIAEKANQILNIPVYRIDEAMALKVVEVGSNISVLATLRTTLNPTVNLIKKKAQAINKKITINTILVDGAYEALINGDKETHNQKIINKIKEYINSDVIVLAQASMASAIPLDIDKTKILTSPELGIDKLKKDLD